MSSKTIINIDQEVTGTLPVHNILHFSPTRLFSVEPCYMERIAKLKTEISENKISYRHAKMVIKLIKESWRCIHAA